VSNLLTDELLAVKLGDSKRLKDTLNQQQHVILAIDGLQPDMGQEVLWVIQDCLSGEILAQTLCRPPLKTWRLLKQVKQALSVPVQGN